MSILQQMPYFHRGFGDADVVGNLFVEASGCNMGHDLALEAREPRASRRLTYLPMSPMPRSFKGERRWRHEERRRRSFDDNASRVRLQQRHFLSLLPGNCDRSTEFENFSSFSVLERYRCHYDSRDDDGGLRGSLEASGDLPHAAKRQ